MVIARWLERDLAGPIQRPEHRDEVIEIRLGIRHADHPALAIGQLEQHLMGQLRNVDRYPHRRRRGRRR
jgi:hypothetical protein